jgi:hypothetical protein
MPISPKLRGAPNWLVTAITTTSGLARL